MAKPLNFTERQKNDIVRLYNMGASFSMIGRALNTDYTCINEYCNKLIKEGKLKKNKIKYKRTQQEIQELQKVIDGIASQDIEYKDSVDTGKVFALWHARWSIEEIAHEMELNPKQVEQILDSEV